MKATVKFLAVVLFVAGASPAWSAITYVDATANTNGSDGNTTFNSANINFGVNATPPNTILGGSLGDSFWARRTGDNGVNTNVWETDAVGAEDAPPLITTITLAPGTYNLYGLFHIENTHSPLDEGYTPGSFDVNFRVGNSGSYTTFNSGNASLTAADGSDFSNAVTTRDTITHELALYMAPLGQFVVASSVEIYVQGNSVGGRTWYDGVGFELVPEPSSGALILAGSCVLLRRRRRKSCAA